MPKTLFQFVLMLSLLLTACGLATSKTDDTDGPKTPQALQPTAVSTALFQIVKADGTSFGVTLDDLKTLPLAQVQGDDGKMEEGPYLRDVLH